MHKGSTPARIIDILEMEQGWMNIHALIADLELRWGTASDGAVRQAVHRLTKKALIQSRVTESRLNEDRNHFKELEVRAA